MLAASRRFGNGEISALSPEMPRASFRFYDANAPTISALKAPMLAIFVRQQKVQEHKRRVVADPPSAEAMTYDY
jgi:hypothetical protein